MLAEKFYSDPPQQRRLVQQMERHIHEQAYFLFLYSPVQLYAVNKAVQFTPDASGRLDLTAITVAEQHWSVRQEKTAGQK